MDDDNHSVDTDLSEIGICSLNNSSEYIYNVVLILTQMGNYSKALEKITTLIKTALINFRQ